MSQQIPSSGSRFLPPFRAGHRLRRCFRPLWYNPSGSGKIPASWSRKGEPLNRSRSQIKFPRRENGRLQRWSWNCLIPVLPGHFPRRRCRWWKPVPRIHTGFWGNGLWRIARSLTALLSCGRPELRFSNFRWWKVGRADRRQRSARCWSAAFFRSCLFESQRQSNRRALCLHNRRSNR